MTRLCRAQGFAVNYLTTSQKKISSETDYQGYYWNPSQGELDTTSLEGVNAIIHLAGASIAQKWTPKNKQLIKDSRIKSVQLLYDALVRFRESGNNTVKHVISASAIGCYPSSPTKLYNEKYPDYAAGFLGEVVKEWEEAVIEFQRLDIATASIRTGIILDKEEGALPQMVKPVRFFAGARY